MKVLETVAVATGKGEARWWFGQLAEIKATAADTGGQFTLVEVTCPPGYQGIRQRMQLEAECDTATKELQLGAEVSVHGLPRKTCAFRDQGDGGQRRADGRVKLVRRLRDPAPSVLDLVASFDHLVLAGHISKDIR